MGVSYPPGVSTEGGIADLKMSEVDVSTSRDSLDSDMQKILRYDNTGGDRTYTVDSTASHPLDSFVDIYKIASGNDLSIVRSGVTFEGVLGNVNFKVDGEQGSSVRLRQRETNIWVYSGTVKSF